MERAVDDLVLLDRDVLTVLELQETTASIVRLQERLAAVRSTVLADLAARSGGIVRAADNPGGTGTAVQHWLRDVAGTGGPAAARDVREAGLLRRLPLVRAAVLDGRLAMAHALVLTRLVDRIDDGPLAEAEPNLVDVAVGRDPHSLGVYVAHLLATWCEPQFDADERTQQSKRYLQTRRESDGMLSGRFRLPSAESEALLTVLEPLARRQGVRDMREAGQRRADALVEVFAQVLRFGDLPEAGGFRPQVSYVVGAAWAAGQGVPGSLRDLVRASLPGASGEAPVEARCAVGAWSGPQTRSRMEMVLCDARLTRVLLDPLGQVTGLEALGDTVTKAQRRALSARDQGCAVRGCTRPPAFCDAHHLDHLADGGSTELGNLVLLCRRHHTLWHQGRLTLHQLHVPWITGTHDPPGLLNHVA